MASMVKYPESTKHSLESRLGSRASARWPQLASITVHHRANFTYVDAILPEGTTLKLCRLRYIGSAHDWGMAIYRASHADYADSLFPTGSPIGTCQDALDLACSLYLGEPFTPTTMQPPTN